MDLEVASEFVQMASHLLYIKTKSVLSKDDENPELEFLITSLEQLKARDSYNEIKTVVPFFEETAKRGLLYYTKNAEPDPENSGAYSYNHKALELLQALYDTFSRNDAAAVLPEAENVVPSKVIYSIKEKCSEILRNLISERSVNLAKLYGSCASRSELVATFVSILELCSLGNIQIRKYGNGYSVRYVSGDIGEILDSIAG
jgi:segregation and condensation protein A